MTRSDGNLSSSVDVKSIDRKRFDAIIVESRHPNAALLGKELEWMSTNNEAALGVVLLDKTDLDYAIVILTKAEDDRFKANDIEVSFSTQQDASQRLIKILESYNKVDTSEADRDVSKMDVNIFDVSDTSRNYHPDFLTLTQSPAFKPARKIISNLMPHFKDIDGNFIEQFQTTGFDSRVWELYLYNYFVEEQLELDRTHSSPDFLLNKMGKEVAVEAVTVGRKQADQRTAVRRLPKEITIEEIANRNQDSMPIRYGSPLYSKLNKQYWTLSHVEGKPLVLAIADFHDDQSMLWSSTALNNYLYGVRHNFYHDNEGKLIITPERIQSHKEGEKEIPSGYFFQPDTENISAILFSSSGTISKFSRIGIQAGYGDPKIHTFRKGTCHNHDPNASMPHEFHYEVSQISNETWGEGISFYHNPNALYPVDYSLFPSVAHHKYDNGQIISILPDFHVYSSFTYHLCPKK